MKVMPIKTRIVQPPQDDILPILKESLGEMKEGDILAVSSKIVSIHEGNCIAKDSIEKKELVLAEADIAIPRTYWSSPLTVKHYAFIGTAGVDESNADGYYIPLPEKPMKSAEVIYRYIQTELSLKNFGVIITDSHSSPMRRGAMGVGIGFWGFYPTINHVGEEDLFKRELKIEVTNVLDGLAAAANIVMGETDECQPLAILRDAPNLKFVDEDRGQDIFVDFSEDTFRVLYEDFLA